jgi:hypothetical protein
MRNLKKVVRQLAMGRQAKYLFHVEMNVGTVFDLVVALILISIGHMMVSGVKPW